MAKYKKQMWDKEGSEPVGYAEESDPLHGMDFALGRTDLVDAAKRIANQIKRWMGEKKTDLNSFCAAERKKWIAAGGNGLTWDTVLQQALQMSGYYRAMSQETKATAQIKEEKTRRKIIKIKPAPAPKFNGLDLSAIKL